MQKYLKILWIWFWLKKHEIKSICTKKIIKFHPSKTISNKEFFEKKMMELKWAYDYLMENFDDYINEKDQIKHSGLYYFNQWLYYYYIENKYDLAYENFNNSIKKKKDYPNTYLMLAKYHEKFWEYDKAIVSYDNVLKYEPNYKIAYMGKINLLKLTWKYKELEYSKLTELVDNIDEYKLKRIAKNNFKSQKRLSSYCHKKIEDILDIPAYIRNN